MAVAAPINSSSATQPPSPSLYLIPFLFLLFPSTSTSTTTTACRPTSFASAPPTPLSTPRPFSQIAPMPLSATVTARIFLLAVVVATAFHGIASAQAQAPAPGPSAGTTMDCFTTLLNMSDCLSYVTAGSNTTAPDKQCCPELAGLVESNPTCLCQLLSDPEKIGLKVDVQRALKLPAVCKVSTPPVRLCSVLGYPVGGAASPAPSTLPPDVQPPDAGDSSTATPANTGDRASRIDRLHLAFPLGLALAFLPTLL